MEGLHKEAQGSEEGLRKEMIAEWREKSDAFNEAVNEAESVEEILGLLKGFGIKEKREYNNGKRVVFHEEGASASVDELRKLVATYAEAVSDDNRNALYELEDVGIPNVVKQKLHTLYGKG